MKASKPFLQSKKSIIRIPLLSPKIKRGRGKKPKADRYRRFLFFFHFSARSHAAIEIFQLSTLAPLWAVFRRDFCDLCALLRSFDRNPEPRRKTRRAWRTALSYYTTLTRDDARRGDRGARTALKLRYDTDDRLCVNHEILSWACLWPKSERRCQPPASSLSLFQ